jgi:hypothetical protein
MRNETSPKWCISLKPVVHSEGKKQVNFHNAQATARKDMERAFGILQTQFSIVREDMIANF